MKDTNKVPEDKKDFYYWLVENVSVRAANLWLDGKWEDLIIEIRED